MPGLNEQQLEKYAAEVVDAFFKESIPLTDGVVKIAERETLNPEQVRRLVEAVNNMTFQRKFSAAEGTDRMDASQFETASPDSALQRLISAAKDLMEEQSGGESVSDDLASDLPTTRPDAPQLNPAGPEDNFTPAGEPKVSGTVVIMKLRKTAELLRDQQYQHRVRFTESFRDLATRFTRMGTPAFEAFEKDAFYKWGNRAVPYLSMLRGVLNKPAATYDHDTMVKVGRIIDTNTPLMQLFRETMEHSENVALAEQGQEKVAGYLKSLNA